MEPATVLSRTKVATDRKVPTHSTLPASPEDTFPQPSITGVHAEVHSALTQMGLLKHGRIAEAFSRCTTTTPEIGFKETLCTIIALAFERNAAVRDILLAEICHAKSLPTHPILFTGKMPQDEIRRVLWPMDEQGAIAITYKVYDLLTEELYVRKLLPSEHPHSPEALVHKALSKSGATAQYIRHGITLRRSGEKTPHVDMELLYGCTVRTLQDEWRAIQEREQCFDHLPLRLIVEIARETSRALYTLCACDPSFVHRDIKPANIWLENNKQNLGVKLIDFGTAKSLHIAYGGTAQQKHEDFAGCGTPDYMAPEQFESPKEVTSKADVYALGSTVYHLATGHTAYQGIGFCDLAHRVRTTPLHTAQIEHPDLCNIVKEMMAKHPDRRWDILQSLSALSELSDQLGK